MDTIEITEIEAGKPLAYPVVCDVRLHDEGCELWCSEFSQSADGLDVEHAKQRMVSYITQSSRADLLRTEPAVRGELLLRLSDNVLDEPDWPVYRIKLEHGKIVSRTVVNQGAYGDDGTPAVGDGLPKVAEWLSYEGSGTHPENYYTVFDPRDGHWHSFVGPRELEVIGSLEMTGVQRHKFNMQLVRRNR